MTSGPRRPGSARVIRRSVAAVLCLVVVLALPASAGSARREKGPRTLGAAVSPLRLVPSGGQLSVAGLHSYLGELHLGSFGDGLALENKLPIERYLWGLQEVPTSWPDEALRAQVIAARTYTLYTLATGSGGGAATYGFDICATVQCQVFSGADVVNSANGPRWVDAVTSTKGKTLLYDGKPLLARYHSTSGGQTLDNPQAFPTEPAFPYLRSVSSTTEEGSPLYRWETTFTLAHLQRVLTQAGWWNRERQGRLQSATSVESKDGFHYPDIVFDGKKGDFRITVEGFRDVVRDLAPAMYPGLYPGRWPTTSGFLPETLPSNRVEIVTEGKVVRVIGRGWGHGVGMSQWGAEGMARRGATHEQILTHYYTGASIGRARTARPVEVGVSTAQSAITVTGSFKIVDGRGKTLVADALGSWVFRYAGSGAVQIDPPPGYGLPLRIGVVNAPTSVEPGELAFFTIALSKPAKIRIVTAPAGAPPRDLSVRGAGRKKVAWRAPTTPGAYSVRVTASTATASKRSEKIEITVTEPPSPSPSPSVAESPGAQALPPSEEVGDRALAVVALVLLLCVTGAAVVLAGKIGP